MILYRTLRDELVNLILNLKTTFRYYFGISKKGSDFWKDLHSTKDYTCVLHNTHSKTDGFWDNWDANYDDWQPYHPDHLHQWYSSQLSRLTKNGLEFDAVMLPRYFPELKKTIPAAIGKVRSRKSFSYGIFVFVAKLPAGRGLWPAIWLTGENTWPPEIDIMEGYSGDTIDFYDYRMLQSNIHTSSGEFGAYTHRVKQAEEFMEYALWWTKDFIRIYYHGYRVLDVTNKKVLASMNDRMKIIVGTGTQKDHFRSDNLSPLVLKSVTVYQQI